MSFKCDFCGNNLKSMYSLEYHKKNSKKCLTIQNKDLDESLLSCEFCLNYFSKYNLKFHLNVCSEKQSFEIKKVDELNIQLKNENKKLLDENNKLLDENNKLQNENKKLLNETKELRNVFSSMKEELDEIKTKKIYFQNENSNLRNELTIYKNLFDKKDQVIVNMAKESKNSHMR